jgi:hypothetical protein
MRARTLVVVVALVLAAGCGGSDDDGDDDASGDRDTTTTTEVDETTTTTESDVDDTEPEATGGNDCDTALGEVFTALDTLFDQAEGDPASVAEESDAITEAMTELGENLGGSCADDPADALSQVVLHIADEADARTGISQEVATGLLGGLCGSLGAQIELSADAEAACAAAVAEG